MPKQPSIDLKFVRSKTVFSLIWVRTKDGMICYDYELCKGKGNPFVKLQNKGIPNVT